MRAEPPPLPDAASLASEDDVMELTLHEVSLDDEPTAVAPVPRMSPLPAEPEAAPVPATTLPAPPPSIEPEVVAVPTAPAVPREGLVQDTSAVRDDDTATFAAAMRPRRSAAALAVTVGLHARALGIFAALLAAASFAWLRANLPRLRLWITAMRGRAREEWSHAVERASSRRS